MTEKQVSGNRGLRNRKAVSTSMEPRLYESLNLISEKTRVPKTKLVDEAIEMLVERYIEREVI